MSAHRATLALTRAARENVAECGMGPDEVNLDRRRIRDGQYTAEQLLAGCLAGATADRVAGWREYVATIVEAANANQEIDCIADLPPVDLDEGAPAKPVSA